MRMCLLLLRRRIRDHGQFDQGLLKLTVGYTRVLEVGPFDLQEDFLAGLAEDVGSGEVGGGAVVTNFPQQQTEGPMLRRA